MILKGNIAVKKRGMRIEKEPLGHLFIFNKKRFFHLMQRPEG